ARPTRQAKTKPAREPARRQDGRRLCSLGESPRVECGDAREHAAVRYWIADFQRYRDHSRPDREVIVFVIIYLRTGADLRGNFVEGKGEDAGSFQFLVRRRTYFIPTIRHDVVGEALQRFHFFLRIVYEARLSEHDHRSMVHRMMKTGACEDESIEQRHGD